MLGTVAELELKSEAAEQVVCQKLVCERRNPPKFR